MSDELWIEVCRWEDFQHREAGRGLETTWIRNWTRLLHNDDYLSLTAPQRALLHGLWMLYAMSRRNIPENTSKLSRELNLRVTKRTLEALNHAGFIQFSARNPARTEEIRKETPLPPYGEKPKKPAHTHPKTKPEPRPAAAAYQPFQNNPPAAPLNPTEALEHARRLAGQPHNR